MYDTFGDLFKRQIKKSHEKTRRLRTNPHGNFKESVEGVAIFLQIAMTLYGNKNLEEMRTNSKIIIQRQNKEKSRESGKL